VALEPRTVADFHAAVATALTELNIPVRINEYPCEIAGATRFGEDRLHSAYDGQYAQRFWQVLVQVDRVFKQFRTGFVGKASPVHFFWGSFDLAVTRFSGRRAPERPGADRITREAYSHDVISAGFWPGSASVQEAAFYAYAAPEPAGLREIALQPTAAYYHPPMGIFILPYAAVRAAPSPDDAVMAFLHGTYDAAANLAGWDRKALERPITDSAPPARRETE